jgi:hypothetical protein
MSLGFIGSMVCSRAVEGEEEKVKGRGNEIQLESHCESLQGQERERTARRTVDSRLRGVFYKYVSRFLVATVARFLFLFILCHRSTFVSSNSFCPFIPSQPLPSYQRTLRPCRLYDGSARPLSMVLSPQLIFCRGSTRAWKLWKVIH